MSCRVSSFSGEGIIVSWFRKILILYVVEAILSPRRAYLISDLPERGLIERGAYQRGLAYSQNQVTRIYLVASQFFYPIFLWN